MLELNNGSWNLLVLTYRDRPGGFLHTAWAGGSTAAPAQCIVKQ